MDAGDGGGVVVVMPPEGYALLAEGIALVLSQWTALQMAVENEWGGPDTHQKVEELGNRILSWFIQTRPPLYIDDLENILDEHLVLSFNTEIEDGSIEEVAEQLMVMHEDCLRGNYESIEKLRKSNSVKAAISQSKREDETSEEDESDMQVDEPKPKEASVGEQKPMEMPDEEGWSVVPTRRNRGRLLG